MSSNECGSTMAHISKQQWRHTHEKNKHLNSCKYLEQFENKKKIQNSNKQTL